MLLFTHFLLHCVAKVFYIDSRSFPELFLFMNNCLTVDLCWGERSWGLLHHHCGDIIQALLLKMLFSGRKIYSVEENFIKKNKLVTQNSLDSVFKNQFDAFKLCTSYLPPPTHTLLRMLAAFYKVLQKR